MICSDWIALTDVIITAILTAIIIFQTSKLSKRQQQFEEKENQREIDLQKRQIQIETYPYKREIYTNTFAILECCHFLKELSTKVDLKSKTGKELSEMFSEICKGYVPDIKKTLWSLREAEYVLPDNISACILDIRACFDRLGACLNALGPIEKILNDVELKQYFQDTKDANISSALSACDRILSYTDFIESNLPQELRISGLNR